jgi:hypothetical protein
LEAGAGVAAAFFQFAVEESDDFGPVVDREPTLLDDEIGEWLGRVGARQGAGEVGGVEEVGLDGGEQVTVIVHWPRDPGDKLGAGVERHCNNGDAGKCLERDGVPTDAPQGSGAEVVSGSFETNLFLLRLVPDVLTGNAGGALDGAASPSSATAGGAT